VTEAEFFATPSLVWHILWVQEEQRVSHLGMRALIGPSGALKRQKAIKAVRAIRLNCLVLSARTFYVLRRLRIDCAQIKRSFASPCHPLPPHEGGERRGRECKKWLAQIETLAALGACQLFILSDSTKTQTHSSKATLDFWRGEECQSFTAACGGKSGFYNTVPQSA